MTNTLVNSKRFSVKTVLTLTSHQYQVLISIDSIRRKSYYQLEVIHFKN